MTLTFLHDVMRRFPGFSATVVLSLVFPLVAPAEGPAVNVQLDIAKAGPRAVEDVTRNRIVVDYRLAWASIGHAFESDTVEPLQGLFTGSAKEWLSETVSEQKQTGLTMRYSDQSHRVDVVFYAPEGDVMELHDTASYNMQLLDRGKAIHDEQVVQHYIVLMTPGADRWVIRQLQAVSRF